MYDLYGICYYRGIIDGVLLLGIIILTAFIIFKILERKNDNKSNWR